MQRKPICAEKTVKQMCSKQQKPETDNADSVAMSASSPFLRPEREQLCKTEMTKGDD